jgi:radical SAM superfamily enzyme YgiQ (UPF0313 family)
MLLSANFCDDPYAVYPLGMSVIAGALSAAGHQVLQFDANIYAPAIWMELFKQEAAAFRPDLIGCSMRNLDTIADSSDESLIFSTVATIQFLRPQLSVPWVLGGSGFSLCPEHLLELTGAEYGIIGAGEAAIVELASELEQGKKITRQIWTKSAATQAGAIYPDNIADYYYMQTHLLPIQTKRGCPFNCVYCTYPALEGSTVTVRDTAAVMTDIQTLRRRYPEAMLYFVDAVFNDPARHYHQLLRQMLESGVTAPWCAFITPANLQEKDVAMMASTGMIAADLGIDGATDTTLTGLGKGYDFAAVRRACGMLRRHNISVTASVIFGGPGENRQTVIDGINNLRSLNEVFCTVTAGIRLIKGMPLLNSLKGSGLIPADWDGIQPLTYFSPDLERQWLEAQLAAGFADSPYCIYPANKRHQEIKLIHKFGFAKWHKNNSQKAKQKI